jgi:hypothetical protein
MAQLEQQMAVPLVRLVLPQVVLAVLVAQAVAVAVKTVEHLHLPLSMVVLVVKAGAQVMQELPQVELEPMARQQVRQQGTAEPLNQHQVAQVAVVRALSAVKQHYCPKRALMRLPLHLYWAISQVVAVALVVMLLAHPLHRAQVVVAADGSQEPLELRTKLLHRKHAVSVVMVLLYGAKQHRGGI